MTNDLTEYGFGGHVGLTADESEPWFPAPTTPPEGAPNVVVVVLDDVGYAQVGCYGSDIETPNIDALAQRGTQFTNFHVTPLCSPTRAALLSGRNHHTVGMGTITGFPGGFPNTREHVHPRAQLLPAMLKANGYGTYAVGKWHLGPMGHMTGAGRFDHWPLSKGFDRFYGFLGGETDQFRPNLVHDNHFIDPPDRDDYHLSEDLVDQAGQFIVDHRSAAPNRPFFLYLAFGACHGPHQVPDSYRDKYRGRYDDGWDAVRERWWRRQLDRGVIPPGTELAPRNPDVQPWGDLTSEQRTIAVRFHEVYAAFLDHTDAQIGRLLDTLAMVDADEDTVVIVMSDNGAAGEGGDLGDWNEIRQLNGLTADVADSLRRLDEVGSESTYPVYPRGWAQVGNTPLKWYKHHTFGGGVRAPLVITGLPDRQPGTRDEGFRHVTDMVPTVLELVGIDAPVRMNGIEQLPLTGRSLLGSQPPSGRTQYFEMLGHRGIYHDGYKAVTFHTPDSDYHTERWELYHLAEDFSECNDLADAEPERLQSMISRWWAEAGRHGVLPLDDRFLERAQQRAGTDLEGIREFTLYRGTVRIPESAAPDLRASRFDMSTTLRNVGPDAEGILLSFGGRFGGFVWFVADGRSHVTYNCFGRLTTISADQRLAVGEGTVRLTWTKHDRTPTSGARMELWHHGAVVGGGDLDRIVPYYAGGNGVEVGHNRLSPVDPNLPNPYEFTGEFDRITIVVEPDDDAEHVATSRLRAE